MITPSINHILTANSVILLWPACFEVNYSICIRENLHCDWLNFQHRDIPVLVQESWLVHLLWKGWLSSHAHSLSLWWQNPEQQTCLPHDPSQLSSIIVSRLSSCLWSAAHSTAAKGTVGFLLQVRAQCMQTLGGCVLWDHRDKCVSDVSCWQGWETKKNKNESKGWGNYRLYFHDRISRSRTYTPKYKMMCLKECDQSEI